MFAYNYPILNLISLLQWKDRISTRKLKYSYFEFNYITEYDAKFLKKTKHYDLLTILTLILPTLKMISLCHQYRARPASTSMESDQALYFWLLI